MRWLKRAYHFDLKAQGSQKKQKTTRKPKKKENSIELKFGAFLEIGCFKAILPIKTISEGNSFENWKKKHARHLKQKGDVAIAISPHLHNITLPCEITLTRYAPRFLDRHDNLPMSFKYIADSVSNCLIPGKKAGQADSDPRLIWKYDQIKFSGYAISIEIKNVAP